MNSKEGIKKIVIISGSVREGRESHRVALFLAAFLKNYSHVQAEIIDLSVYNFPIFKERLKYQVNPSAEAIQFAEKIKFADGVIIVTPEYNGGYPASVKNVIDLLTDEWKRKPVAISTVSNGNFGGSQVVQQLQFVLWKIGAIVVPAMYPVPKVNENYSEDGIAVDIESANKRAANFISELLRQIEVR
jgi:NAD(P)H-dependent FMN reductase